MDYLAVMKIGFIGIGKIASAMIEGLNTSKATGLEIVLSPRNETLSTRLAAKYPNVRRLGSNQEVLDHSDIVVIALRPAVAVEELQTLSFRPHHTVVSLIPLLRFADLSAVVQPAGAVCRAIPLPTVMEHNCPIPLFRAPATVTELFGYIGQPLPVANEEQLHAIWTLTGLITPFYELLGGLSEWTIAHGVDEAVANTYIADLFQSLSYMAQRSSPIDFSALAQHAATPNGMNEQAGKEIREKGAHTAWEMAAERLLARFK
jgi:pyrroline-5-carboxylate reductase